MFDCSSVASTNIRLLNKTGEFVEKDLNNRIDSRCLSISFFFFGRAKLTVLVSVSHDQSMSGDQIREC